MGMVGQGVRTIVGLKKLSDVYDTAPVRPMHSVQPEFSSA